MDAQTEHLIVEAALAFRSGELSALSAMIVIDSFLFPVPISKEDMAWAREHLGLPTPKSGSEQLDASVER